MQGSGNLWEASSLNTERWQWYLARIFLSPICDPACSASLEARVCFLSGEVGMDTQVMCIKLAMDDVCQWVLLRPTGVVVHWAIRDSRAFLVWRMSGNCLLSIHPQAQSIFG